MVSAGVAGAFLLGVFIGRLGRTTPLPSPNSIPAPDAKALSVLAARGARTDGAVARSRPRHAQNPREETLNHSQDPVARLQSENLTGSDIGRVVRIIGIVSQLSKDEIPNVLAYGLSVTGEQREEREIVLFGALARWAQFDPLAVAEWTRSNSASSLQGKDDDLLQMALAEWTARDATAARAWIDQLEDGGQKTGALRGYFETLAARDPMLALREMERLPTDERDQRSYVAIFRTWSSKDPRAAAQAAANLSGADEDDRRHVLETIAQVWAQQSPREAVAWALQLSNPQEQAQLVRNVLGGWVQREADAAVSQLLSLPAPLRDEVARDVVESVARQNFDNARRIAEQLPPGRAREQAVGTVAVNWADRDPMAAANFARDLSEEAAADAWPKIARNWVQRGEPSATAQWVAQLPEGAARSGAARNVIDRWAKIEPAAAAQWVQQLPAGPTRDAAAATFATEVRGTDPATAMEWAATVSNLDQRENTVRQVLDTWRKKDGAAARAWLENTNAIGADLRSVLLRTP